MKKIIILAVALFAVAGSAVAQKAAKQIVTTVFLTDIDCEGCAKKINNSLPYAKGVKDVKVDVKTKKVTVTYDATKTSDSALIKALAKVKIKAEVSK